MHSADRSTRAWWTWARAACGALIVLVLLLRVGVGPFVDGLRSVSVGAAVAAVALTVVTTTCAAWRWSVVARELAVDVPVRTAIAAYYRSQFLNATLPGGVLGDVHRAVRHGRDVDAVWRSARSVAWERVLGQLVQVVLTLLAVLVLSSPLRPGGAPLAVGGLALLLVTGVLVAAAGVGRRGPPSSRVAVAARAVVDDLQRLLLCRRTGPAVVVSSAVVVAGHLAVFVAATRAVGVDVPTGSLVVLGLVVLLGAAVPTNIAGWGPREGVAAWAFAMVGAGAATGVTVATLYGVLSLLACLPGALLLLVHRTERRARAGPTSRRAADPDLEVAR